MGEKNKTCATKTLFTDFTRATVMEQGVKLQANQLVRESTLFVHCSKDKITCKTDLHFCELW